MEYYFFFFLSICLHFSIFGELLGRLRLRCIMCNVLCMSRLNRNYLLATKIVGFCFAKQKI